MRVLPAGVMERREFSQRGLQVPSQEGLEKYSSLSENDNFGFLISLWEIIFFQQIIYIVSLCAYGHSKFYLWQDKAVKTPVELKLE